MRRWLALLLAVTMLICCSTSAYAVGEGNIDGGGSGMGSGSSTSYWNPGNDGVRITIVRDSDNTPVSIPIDFSNINTASVQIHFGKLNKISYRDGQALSTQFGLYESIKPQLTMPQIISSSGGNNIPAIKSYFCREGTIRDIATATSFDYDDLISGEYKILLEPIAYFKFQGIFMGMTAHEASLYDLTTSSQLRSAMGSLTAKNQPLSMFLEVSDLGFPAWSGSRTSHASNSDIQAALGLGIIRFSEPDEEIPSGGTADYTYRTNTQVITSVVAATTAQRTPDNPAYVRFSINGSTYTHSDIYIPEYDSQLAWAKWTTPDRPCIITITVSSNVSVSADTITVKVVDMDENIPPDPKANDRNDSYSIPAAPATPNTASLTWGEWDCWWHPFWVWHSDWDWEDEGCDSGCDDDCSDGHGSWVDNGEWVDEGWWEYEWLSYSASITASMGISPDSRVPTAMGSTMKSGYGFNMEVSGRLSTSAPTGHVTPIQNVVSYFPEFQYQWYWRLLERTASGYSSAYEFKHNEYSTYNERAHFTPVWFPDGRYTAYAEVLDAWTPAGMLQINLTDSLTIRDNLFSDWHIGPYR